MSLAELGPRRAQTEIRRIERALEKLAAIDFHAGPAAAQAAAAMDDLKASYRAAFARGEPRHSRRPLRRLDAARYRNRTWATRRSPWVDRLASAWLIKRFIDRDARFAWIARPSERPKNAIGFDFDGAEFTHAGHRVTYEVLLASFGLDADPALAEIGAAVHFLDVGGIPVPDAKGLETMLKGAREKARSDDALLAHSMRAFDLLYSGYRTA
ncbi:MAG: chromate resistance protein [Burkholderiales bacterium]|nr:chromate resistance protein [Burkholderiales bacterium]